MADTKISALTAGAALGGTEAIPAVQTAANVRITPAQLQTYVLASYAGASTITTLGTIATGVWNGTAIPVANGGTGSATAADARTALGLAIGTNVQAYDADLVAIAALTSAADKIPYSTAAQTWALADFTASGRAMVATASAAAQTALLSAVVGDSGAGGTKGLVPAPGAGDAAAGKFLKADGTFAVPAGAGGSPAGSSLTIQYNNASSFGGMSGTSWDDTNRSLTLTGATVTTSKPVLDLSQTWNDGAVTFTGLKFNVTNTASATASMLLDLQVGGTSAFLFQRNGILSLVNTGTGYSAALQFGYGTGIGFGATSGNLYFTSGGDNYFAFKANVFGFTAAGSVTIDAGITRNAADILEINNGTPGTYRDILTRGLRSNAVAFASAIAAPVQGTIQAFTDSSTATWGATITGGGANKVLGHYNGTNWTVLAA